MNPLIEAFYKHKVSIATFYSISCLFIDIIQIFMAFVHRLAFCCVLCRIGVVFLFFFVFLFLSLLLFFSETHLPMLIIIDIWCYNEKLQKSKRKKNWNANICCCRFFIVFFPSCWLLFAHILRCKIIFRTFIYAPSLSVLGFNTFYFVYWFSCVALFSLVPMPIISFRCTIYCIFKWFNK